MEEQEKFTKVLQEDKLGLFFILDLATGMRKGELLALEWKNVDLKQGVIWVKQSLSRVRTNFTENSTANKTEIVFQNHKTKKGERSIPLLDSIVTLLKRHKDLQRQERKDLGLGEIYNGFVFATYSIDKDTVATKPIEPRNITRKFYSLVKKSGILKANLHSLRHTFATRLLEQNEHVKTVKEMLGHASVTLTLDTYSHVMPELKKSAVNKLSNLFIFENAAQK